MNDNKANKIVIDEELKGFIPQLAEDEFKQLEQNIIKEGCLDALILWGNILIDGHNRYKICTKHNINFKTIQMKFLNKNEVKIWMRTNQLGKRTDLLAIRLKSEDSKKNSVAPVNIVNKISDISGVSQKMISKVKFIEANATNEQKNEIRIKDKTINEVYETLKGRPKTPPIKLNNKTIKMFDLTDEMLNTVTDTDGDNWVFNTKKDVVCEICGNNDVKRLMNNPKIKKYNTICIHCYSGCVAKIMVRA